MASDPIEIQTVIEARKKVGRDGLGYVWTIDDPGIEIHVDYLNGRGDELLGEIAITLRGRHLHMARFNLSDSNKRWILTRTLKEQTNGLEIPWDRFIEQFCVAVLRREREGSPTQYPSQATRQPTVYLVDNLVIQGKTNTLFAPGGSGKGYLSVGLCCACATKRSLGDLTVMEARPLYLDWEDDFATFNDRLNSVSRGFGVDLPRIPYKRMRGLFSDRINEIARVVTDEDANFIIVDSFSAAGGSVTERTSWDAIAHRFFDAVDLIPDVTWFIVDHVVGSAGKDPVGKSFGSIQKQNRVRNGWEMRNEQEPGSLVSHMRLFDAKWNHTGHRRAFGIRMEFTDDAVTFAGEDPTDSATNEANLPDRMALELDKGPRSIKGLALVLDVEDGSIRTALSRDARQPSLVRRFARSKEGLVRLLRDEPQADSQPEPLPWWE